MAKHGMSTGEVARGMKVDKKTIGNWLKDTRLQPFFSAGALRRDGAVTAVFNDDDLLVLNTIRALTAGKPNNAKDWAMVARRLGEGYRDPVFPPEAAFIESGIVAHSVMVQAGAAIARRDAAELQNEALTHRYELLLAEKDRLLAEMNAKIAESEARHAAEKADILREMGKVMQAKGELVGMLKSLGFDPETGRPIEKGDSPSLIRRLFGTE